MLQSLTTSRPMAGNFIFSAEEERRMDGEILLDTNSINTAIITLSNAIINLMSNTKMQHIVLHRFQGKIRYYNLKLDLKSLIQYDGENWTFEIYNTEEGQNPILAEGPMINTTKGFSCDDMCCILLAFKHAHINRNRTY